MTILGYLVLLVGVCLLLVGTWLCIRSHDDVKQLILRGGLHDAGLVCIGLACPSAAARTGMLLFLIFQAAARYLAYLSAEKLNEVAPAAPGQRELPSLRGAGRLSPVMGTLFSFGMLAAVGGTVFLDPEGRYLINQGAVSALAVTPCVFYSVLLSAATTTAQVFFAVRCVSVIMLEKPAGGQSAPAIKVPSRIKYLACVVAGLGILGSPLYQLAGFIGGFEAVHGSAHISFWILYLGAFLSGACFYYGKKERGTIVGLAMSVLAACSVFAFPAAPLAQVFLVLVCVGAAVIALYSIGYMQHEERLGWYWFFLLMTFASLAGIVSTDSPSSLFGYWELMTFASYFLVAHEADRTAREAGLKYYVMCAGGALFMLPGIILLSGSGHIATVTATVAPAVAEAVKSMSPVWIQAGLFLCLAGFGVKAGIVPLHSWLPDAHPAAPSSVSGPLSGIITKMGFFGIAALCIGQMGAQSIPGYYGLSWLGTGMAVLGAATLFYGEIMALRQDDIKRMLAYSTLGQIGEITIVLSLGTALACAAGFYHILTHAIMKDLLFLAAGAIILRVGTRKLSDMSGAAAQMPVTCTCMLIGLISIMGLPPFAAFYSKFTMIQACVSSGHIWLGAVILTGSFIGVLYYTRIINTLVFAKRPDNAPQLTEAPLTMQVALIALAGASLLFGFFPQLPYGLAAAAATACCGLGAVLPVDSLSIPWPSYVLLPIFGSLIPVLFRFVINKKFTGWSAFFVLVATSILAAINGRDLDMLSYCFAILVPAIGAINVFYAFGYMNHHIGARWRFFAVFVAMCGGLVGMASAQTLLGFFMFWEIMSSWTLYLLLAHEGDKISIQEAFKYFLFNIAGASFIFVGVCVIGGMSPMTVFANIHAPLAAVQGSLPVGLALLAIGFVMKAAQFPVRIDWQMHPSVAPTPASGYISSILLKSAVIGLCKLFIILGAGAPVLYNLVQSQFIMWIGGITIVFAAWQAIRSNHIKLVFIYSTVSQIGYMVLAVAVGAYALAVGANAALGFSGGLLHLINHVLFKDILFLVCGVIMVATNRAHLNRLGGLGRKMPFTMLMFAIAGLSVVGVPPTSGFTSKWIIYHALMNSGQPILALLSLFGSVLTLAYIAKFMHACFLGQPDNTLDTVEEVPLLLKLPMGILAVGCIITGIFPGAAFAPISQIMVEFNIPAIPFTLSSIGSGAMAWNAGAMFIMIAVPFVLGLVYLRCFVCGRIREVDVHNCGLEPEDSNHRMRQASVYGGLAAFFRSQPRDPYRGLSPYSKRRRRYTFDENED